MNLVKTIRLLLNVCLVYGLFNHTLKPSARQKHETLGNFEILQTLLGNFEIFEKLLGNFEIIPNLLGIFEIF